MSPAAMMTIYDQGELRLDDPVKKFIPEFTESLRDRITVRQLLTHVLGLPDQLPDNQLLRQLHAKLSEFVDRPIRTPFLFAPASVYRYSSMGILLAAEVANRICGTEFVQFVEEMVFQALSRRHSALGALPPKHSFCHKALRLTAEGFVATRMRRNPSKCGRS